MHSFGILGIIPAIPQMPDYSYDKPKAKKVAFVSPRVRKEQAITFFLTALSIPICYMLIAA